MPFVVLRHSDSGVGKRKGKKKIPRLQRGVPACSSTALCREGKCPLGKMEGKCSLGEMLVRGGRCSAEPGCRAQPLLQPLPQLLSPAASAPRTTTIHECCQEMGFEPQISHLPSRWGSAAAPSRGLPCTGIPSCRTQHFTRCTGKNSPAGDVRGDTGLHVSMSSFPMDPLRGRKPIRVSCTGTRRAGDTLALPPASPRDWEGSLGSHQPGSKQHFAEQSPQDQHPLPAIPVHPRGPDIRTTPARTPFFFYTLEHLFLREKI